MGFKCGIVGLPNVGKSTLFNALTQTAAAQAANYPFCTIEPNTGEVAVPDPRMKALADSGVSIWLDDLSRTRLQSGNLQGLIDDMSLTGVTTSLTPSMASTRHQVPTGSTSSLLAVQSKPSSFTRPKRAG